MRRRFEPTSRGHDIVPAVAVQIADAVAMTDSNPFRSQLMFLEPWRLVQMLHPNEAAARFLRKIIDEQVLVAVSGQIADDHSFQTVCRNNSVRFPFGAEPARIFVPPNPLPPHPSGTDHIWTAISVYVQSAFVVVIHIRPVCFGAVPVVGVFLPTRGNIEVDRKSVV